LRGSVYLNLFAYFIAVISFCISCGKKTEIQMIKLDHYPSASTIEYFDSKFFVMGDDATNLLILDSDLIVKDSIKLYTNTERRVPKPIKADIEAMTVTNDGKLLLVGSGSLAPFRNGGWIIDPSSRRTEPLIFDTLFQRLKKMGLEVLNVEGICSFRNSILITNRGNNAWRRNDLLLIDDQFWRSQVTSPISMIRLGGNNDSSFAGVSGVDYSRKTDRLFLSMSTENTSSSITDGAIGKSYLWIISNMSSKTGLRSIDADRVIDLEKTDPRFAGQKIESVCVINETKDCVYLALAADNDDGSSTIFKLAIPNN